MLNKIEFLNDWFKSTKLFTQVQNSKDWIEHEQHRIGKKFTREIQVNNIWRTVEIFIKSKEIILFRIDGKLFFEDNQINV